jgi:hypothetical protein
VDLPELLMVKGGGWLPGIERVLFKTYSAAHLASVVSLHCVRSIQDQWLGAAGQGRSRGAAHGGGVGVSAMRRLCDDSDGGSGSDSEDGEDGDKGAQRAGGRSRSRGRGRGRAHSDDGEGEGEGEGEDGTYRGRRKRSCVGAAVGGSPRKATSASRALACAAPAAVRSKGAGGKGVDPAALQVARECLFEPVAIRLLVSSVIKSGAGDTRKAIDTGLVAVGECVCALLHGYVFAVFVVCAVCCPSHCQQLTPVSVHACAGLAQRAWEEDEGDWRAALSRGEHIVSVEDVQTAMRQVTGWFTRFYTRSHPVPGTTLTKGILFRCPSVSRPSHESGVVGT